MQIDKRQAKASCACERRCSHHTCQFPYLLSIAKLLLFHETTKVFRKKKGQGVNYTLSPLCHIGLPSLVYSCIPLASQPLHQNL